MTLGGLIKRIAGIAMVPLLIGVTVVGVDPYNYFGYSHIVPDSLKLKTLNYSGRTMPFSHITWDLARNKHMPARHVLIGDSRLSHFDLEYARELSGIPFTNWGVPGGNYMTTKDLFNYADSVNNLKDVVVQVSFRGMDKASNYDLFSEPRMLMDQPLLYVTNRRVLFATVLNLQAMALPGSVHYDQVPPDHWQQVVDMVRSGSKTFELDSSNYDILRHIADRCKAEGIHLLFIIYPIHGDLVKVYEEAGLGAERERFATEVASIAPTLNLGAVHHFPQDTSIWRDPLHLTRKAQRIVADLIWGQKTYGNIPQATRPVSLIRHTAFTAQKR